MELFVNLICPDGVFDGLSVCRLIAFVLILDLFGVVVSYLNDMRK